MQEEDRGGLGCRGGGAAARLRIELHALAAEEQKRYWLHNPHADRGRGAGQAGQRAAAPRTQLVTQLLLD